MFKLLLISKYLRRKLAPLFAAACVTLCTAMVIIVISVMGGFLDTLRASIQHLSPAVTVTGFSLGGFAHYDELCERLVALPQVKAATPVVQTLGLMEVAGRRTDVQIVGIRPQQLNEVVAFRDVIHWRTPMFVEEVNQRLADPTLSDTERQMYRDLLERYQQMDLVEDAIQLRPGGMWSRHQESEQLPGAIPGVATIPFNRRDEQGRYLIDQHAMGDQITLTTIPLTQKGGLQDPVLRRFVVVNEFKSGHYDYDSSIVFIGFEQLQSMLRMEPFESMELDPETGEQTGRKTQVPGRATAVYVAAAPGVALADLRDAVDAEIARFTRDHTDVPMLGTMTWEEQNSVLLSAVQNEKGMVTFLFVIISVVAVIMVALTFYNIVLQKTWDIGVLRAIGASRTGILGVFLGYGLAIGVLGGGLGLGLAALTIYNLNEIQFFLKSYLGVTAFFAAGCLTLGVIGGSVGIGVGLQRSPSGDSISTDDISHLAIVALIFSMVLGLGLGLIAMIVCAIVTVPNKRLVLWISGLASLGVALGAIGVGTYFALQPEMAAEWNARLSWQMWDPRIYAFDTIPEQMSAFEVTWIVIGAVLSSVIGALIPAVKAATLRPVEAIRYE